MCTFPASELLAAKRKLALFADECTEDEKRPTEMLMMGIDLLRIGHEKTTRCACWYDAIDQEKRNG